MAATHTAGRTTGLPGRPWLIGGAGAVCLVRAHGRTLVPVFRSAADARGFMAGMGATQAPHVYPQFPDEQAFVALLGEALRGGAEGYVLVEPGQWTVIEFATAMPPVPAEASRAFAVA